MSVSMQVMQALYRAFQAIYMGYRAYYRDFIPGPPYNRVLRMLLRPLRSYDHRAPTTTALLRPLRSYDYCAPGAMRAQDYQGLEMDIL